MCKMVKVPFQIKFHEWKYVNKIYHQTPNIERTLVGNKIFDHSHVVGALPIGAAPTTSSFST